jgi:hypothetical protein
VDQAGHGHQDADLGDALELSHLRPLCGLVPDQRWLGMLLFEVLDDGE